MPQHRSRPYDRVKRGLDIIAGAGGLIVTAPLQLAIGALVLIKHGRPVLFRQQRPGRNGEIFELVKFRSMRHPDSDHVTDEQRLTTFGKALRATSLDELPTLWNVLKGDMSLVGPRPALFNQHDLIALRTEAQVHTLRPGLTGWAQVNGRDELPIPEKVKLDAEYLRRQSIVFDLRILWRTVAQVWRGSGVSH